jgi:hypothetical protein
MKEIKLNNHFLIETEDPNKFLFMPNKKEDMEYMRFLYDDTNDPEKIFAFDPSGGPFISIGNKIEGIEGEISEIYIKNSLIYIKFSDGK